jgi:GNAT superfamily N-acetyltransferase
MDYKIDPKLLEQIMKDSQGRDFSRRFLPQRSNPFERNDLEAQRHNAYFEQHWPEYRDSSIADLRESLGSKQPVAEQQLRSGKTLELRVGNYNDADNINMRDHEFYSTTSLAIGRGDTSYFRIASLSYSPLEPVGFYFVMKYPEGDEHWTKKNPEGKRLVGESKLVYVSPNSRGQHLGSILMACSFLDIIDDETIELARGQVANPKMEHALLRLGFKPVGKASYGYEDFTIDLKEREAVRQIFQKYLNQFQAPSHI